MFEVDGEDGLVRFWDCFHSTDRVNASEARGITGASSHNRSQPDPRTRGPRLALDANPAHTKPPWLAGHGRMNTDQ